MRFSTYSCSTQVGCRKFLAGFDQRLCLRYFANSYWVSKGEGKVIPLQARCDPEGG